MKNQKLKGNLMMLIVAFVWGSSFIAQSVGVETISSVTFIAVRSILGGIVLLPFIYILDKKKKKDNIPYQSFFDKTLIVGGLLCGVILCFASLLQTEGMVYTGPGKAAFITALYMVIIPIINLFMGKKPTVYVVLAVLIAVLGMYFLCINSKFEVGKGDILILICAFLYAFHIIVIDYFSPKTDGVKLACMQFFVSGIICALYMIAVEKPDVKPIINSWAAWGYSGVMSCGIAYTLQIVGQKYTDPVSASILMSLESVFATLLSALFVALGINLTGGALGVREIIGCLLMLCAIIIVQIPDVIKSRQAIKNEFGVNI